MGPWWSPGGSVRSDSGILNPRGLQGGACGPEQTPPLLRGTGSLYCALHLLAVTLRSGKDTWASLYLLASSPDCDLHRTERSPPSTTSDLLPVADVLTRTARPATSLPCPRFPPRESVAVAARLPRPSRGAARHGDHVGPALRPVPPSVPSTAEL